MVFWGLVELMKAATMEEVTSCRFPLSILSFLFISSTVVIDECTDTKNDYAIMQSYKRKLARERTMYLLRIGGCNFIYLCIVFHDFGVGELPPTGKFRPKLTPLRKGKGDAKSRK